MMTIKKTLVLDKEIWNEIDEKLGEVSDFEIKETEKMTEIHYSSDGIPKVIYCNKNMKGLIQSFFYCASAFSHKPII